jgi:large subunit ribosomal protein L17
VGDAADMCIIELVDFNETYKAGVTASGSAKARTRRGGSKVAAQKEATDGVSDAVVVEEGAEAPAEKKPAAKKAPAKKPAAAAKPKAAPAPKAGKVSGSKAAGGRSVATKKG